MVPDKFNMVDLGGIDLIMMQGEAVPGLYDKLMVAISNCRYQCLYNWIFDGVLIPPAYVQLTVIDGEVYLNEGVSVTSDDVIHIYSLQPPEPEIIPLLAEENGIYNAPAGVDGYSPVTVSVAGGNANVIIGADIPSASVGNNGDFYLRRRDIPDGITFIEYLQSSGTQYIDTGIHVTELIDVYCKASFHVNEQGSIFGCRTGSWTSMSKGIGVGCNVSQNVRFGFKMGSAYNGDNITKISFANSVFEFQSNSNLFNGKYNFQTKTDSTTNITQTNQNTFTSDLDIRLFGFKISPSGSSVSKCRIYRLTVYQAGAVIADYLPCLDSNNIPCMYEAINGTFVYNDGTGDFAYGEEIQTPAAKNTLYLKEDGAWVVIANNVVVNTIN